MRNRKPDTLKGALKNALIQSVLMFLILCASFAVSTVFGPSAVSPEESLPTGESSVTQSPAEHIEELAKKHDCWLDGNTPEGVIPTHALVTAEGSRWAKVLHADIGFAIWQDGAPGTLHAFCR